MLDTGAEYRIALGNEPKSLIDIDCCRDKKAYDYKDVRRWTLEKRLKRAGQASPSVLDCDRAVVPVRTQDRTQDFDVSGTP